MIAGRQYNLVSVPLPLLLWMDVVIAVNEGGTPLKITRVASHSLPLVSCVAADTVSMATLSVADSGGGGGSSLFSVINILTSLLLRRAEFMSVMIMCHAVTVDGGIQEDRRGEKERYMRCSGLQ